VVVKLPTLEWTE